MKIAGKEIKAAIFDLDGTLLDSNYVWTMIDENFFKERNMPVPPTYVDDIAHLSLKDAAIYTKNTYHFKESVEYIINEWLEGTKKAYFYDIQLKPDVKELLEKCKNEGIVLCVATAGEKELYEPCLKRLGIFDYFTYIADVNVVGAGKDSVKLYHHISEKIGVAPENTAIFEDISIGLKTAYENGYVAVAVYDEQSKKDDENKKKYSHLYINEFKELL